VLEYTLSIDQNVFGLHYTCSCWCVIGLTEVDLQSLVSVSQLLQGSKVSVDDVQNVQLNPEDLLPSLQMLRLIRALRCFLHPQTPAG